MLKIYIIVIIYARKRAHNVSVCGRCLCVFFSSLVCNITIICNFIIFGLITSSPPPPPKSVRPKVSSSPTIIIWYRYRLNGMIGDDLQVSEQQPCSIHVDRRQTEWANGYNNNIYLHIKYTRQRGSLPIAVGMGRVQVKYFNDIFFSSIYFIRIVYNNNDATTATVVGTRARSEDVDSGSFISSRKRPIIITQSSTAVARNV